MSDDDFDGDGRVITTPSAAAALNRSDLETQIELARKYPRSIKRFRDEALAMATYNEKVANECFYALPRKKFDRDKNKWVEVSIEGPSARFAEIINSAWGNCRAGARIIDEGEEFITAQGVFYDLQRLSGITFEVERRIVDSKGQRYGVDMIGVTGNAASSIALRNAILKGVPKAFWQDVYDSARSCAMGDFKTLGTRRAAAIEEFKKFGVSPDQLYAKLGAAGIDDVSLEHLLLMRGWLTALREGDSTPETMFADGAPDDRPRAERASARNGNGKPALPDETAQQQANAAALADALAAQYAQRQTVAREDDPAPLKMPRPASPPGELATKGDRELLLVLLKRAKLPVPIDVLVYEDAGVPRSVPLDTLEGLAKEDFRYLKTKLQVTA